MILSNLKENFCCKLLSRYINPSIKTYIISSFKNLHWDSMAGKTALLLPSSPLFKKERNS